MDFHVTKNIFSPKTLLNNTLSFLDFIKDIVYALLFYPSLQELYEEVSWFDQRGTWPELSFVSATLMRELLPVVKFSDLVDTDQVHWSESCAVCLYEFGGDDEIRLLNCRHIFHRNCVDSWMDHDHKTCPMCRTPFIGEDEEEVFII